MVAAGMNAIAAFQRAIHAPREYGKNDCCTAVNSVLMAHGWPDMLAVYRPYRTAAQWRRAIRRKGHDSLEAALAAAAEQAGAMEMRFCTPRDFDFGIVFVGMDNGVGHVPAFFHDGMWHGLTPAGSVHSIEAMRHWRLDN